MNNEVPPSIQAARLIAQRTKTGAKEYATKRQWQFDITHPSHAYWEKVVKAIEESK